MSSDFVYCFCLGGGGGGESPSHKDKHNEHTSSGCLSYGM